MASSGSIKIGERRLLCHDYTTITVTYYAIVTWDEVYDTQNTLTASNFQIEFSSVAPKTCTCPLTDYPNLNCCGCVSEGARIGYYSPIGTTSSIVHIAYTDGVRQSRTYSYLGKVSVEGVLIVPASSFKSVKLFDFGWCEGQGQTNLTVANSKEPIESRRASITLTASASTTSPNAVTFSSVYDCGAGCRPPKCELSYQVKDQDGVIVKSGEGVSGTVGGLQPNTAYFVRVAVNGGCTGAYDESPVLVTLPGNSISNVSPIDSTSMSVRVVPLNGVGYYPVTHQLQYAKCNNSNWQNGPTTTSTAPITLTVDGLEAETCYQFRVISTSQAGSYIGASTLAETPQVSLATVDITSTDTSYNESTLETTATICYNWVTDVTPATLKFYYRIKNGYETAWQEVFATTVNTGAGDNCFSILNLFPNQVTYELYVATETESGEWQSEVTEFTTPVLPEATSDNCESLAYMTEYLCASVKYLLQDGDLTIFANPYSQQMCQPGDTTPTQLTLWSRALRIAHAYLCILCDFMDLSHAQPGQYFTAELGWVDILSEIVESQLSSDGWKLATSDAIYKYLQEKLKSVWHYQGTVDVMVKAVSDLSSYTTATSAIVTDENAIYTKNNGNWVKNTTLLPEDFGVWHINQESNLAHAESGWYYWGGTWNNLDGDLEKIEAALENLENTQSPVVTSTTPGGIKLTVVDKSVALTAQGEDMLYVVTESQNQPQPIEYTVTYTLADGAVLREQTVISGTVLPSYTPTRQGYTFQGWLWDGTPWVNTTPVTQNMTLVATWEAETLLVNYSISPAVGNAPQDVLVNYGDTLTLPGSGNFNYEGHTFGGWVYDGVLWDNTIPVWENITLEALWKPIMLTIAIRSLPDQADTILHVAYGTTIDPPTPPTRDGFDFVGWVDENGGTINFLTPITSNMTVIATWQQNAVLVTFEANTIPNGAETIANPDPVSVSRGQTVSEPTVTAENYILSYWTLDGAPYDFETPVVDDITLVAVWKQIFDVTFDTDGGEPVPATQKVPDGSYATEPDAPTKDECSFAGWKEEDV